MLGQIQLSPMDIFGLIVPVFVSFINKKVTNPDYRYIVSIVFCAVFALVIDWQMIDSWQSAVANIGVVIFLAQSFFKLYWSKTDMHQYLSGGTK